MAREFANTAGSPSIDGIVYSAVPPVAGLGTVSMVLRAGLDSDHPTDGGLFRCSDAGTLNALGISRVGSTNAIYYVCRNNNAGSIPSIAWTFDGTMRSVVFTFDGSLSGIAKVKAYINGVSTTVVDTFSAGIPNTVIGSGQTRCNIGAATSVPGTNGRIAEAAIYNRVITPAEALIHAAGYSCKHFPRGLIFYAPLIREVHDIAGGLTGTITGTTVSDHPRIYA